MTLSVQKYMYIHIHVHVQGKCAKSTHKQRRKLVKTSSLRIRARFLLRRHIAVGQRCADDVHDARQVVVDVGLDGDGDETDRLEGGRSLLVTLQAAQQVDDRVVGVTVTTKTCR